MLSLVFKDILCQKRNLWLILVYAVFFHVAFHGLPDLGAYVLGAVGITYIFAFGACALEDKNKSDVLLNSLPVKRQSVVKAKYLTGLVFLLVGMAASILVGTVIHYLGFARGLVDRDAIIGMVVAPLLLLSLYYPVYFKFGYLKSRYYNIIIFLLAGFGPSVLVETLAGKIEQEVMPGWLANLTQLISRHDFLLIACLLAAGCLLCLISLFVSVKFYERREFA